jgi:hypothetical protein
MGNSEKLDLLCKLNTQAFIYIEEVITYINYLKDLQKEIEVLIIDLEQQNGINKIEVIE